MCRCHRRVNLSTGKSPRKSEACDRTLINHSNKRALLLQTSMGAMLRAAADGGGHGQECCRAKGLAAGMGSALVGIQEKAETII